MDLRIRAISEKHNFKLFIVDLTNSMREITTLQASNPLASMLLGKITAANSLFGLDLKNGEVMSSTITAQDGAVKKIIAEFQNNNVRSYVQNPHFDPTLFIKENTNPLNLALGQKGHLTVTRQLKGYPAYTSQTDLSVDGIDATFMEYARVSNQIKTLIATKVELDEDLSIKKVVGFMIVLFPEHTEEDIAYLDQKIVNSQEICKLLITSEQQDYWKIVQNLASDAVILETQSLSFECTCNQEKTYQAIKMLGQEEVQKILETEQSLEVTCDFCKKKYTISVDEIRKMLEKW